MDDYYPLSDSLDKDFYFHSNCSDCLGGDLHPYDQNDEELGVLIVDNPEDFKYPWIVSN